MNADLSDRKQMTQMVYESPLPDASGPVGHQTSRICRRGSRRAGQAVAHFAAHVALKVSLSCDSSDSVFKHKYFSLKTRS